MLITTLILLQNNMDLLTDDESDDDEMMRAVAPWACTHCTAHNPRNVSICQQCCRTDFNQKAALAVFANQPKKLPRWNCPRCTARNPGDCSVCFACNRRDLNHAEKINRAHQANNGNEYKILQALEETSIVFSDEPFECQICTEQVAKGDGVRLRSCLHTFCGVCIGRTIEAAETAVVKCPMTNCDGVIEDREIRSIVSQDIYDRHVERSMHEAKPKIANGHQCVTANCKGFWIYEHDKQNFRYTCLLCKKENCVSCKASHPGMDCKEYQDYVFYSTDENAIKTRQQLNAMLKSGEAMQCPQCKVCPFFLFFSLVFFSADGYSVFQSYQSYFTNQGCFVSHR